MNKAELMFFTARNASPHSSSPARPRDRRLVKRVASTAALAVAAPLALAVPQAGADVGAASVPKSTLTTHRAQLPSRSPAAVEAASQRPTQASTQSIGERVISLVNQRRKRNGRGALRAAPKVWRAAMYQSRWQARIDTMTHKGEHGGNAGDRLHAAGYPWRKWGEAVARGYRKPAKLVQAWMDSPGHRDILLMRGVRHIGVSRRTSSDGTMYWTLVVARR